MFRKIQEIFYLIDTEIFQFDTLEAEKIGSKDGKPPKKSAPKVFMTGKGLEIKVGVFWKLEEILYVIGTKIFQIDLLEAEKIGSKDVNST